MPRGVSTGVLRYSVFTLWWVPYSCVEDNILYIYILVIYLYIYIYIIYIYYLFFFSLLTVMSFST